MHRVVRRLLQPIKFLSVATSLLVVVMGFVAAGDALGNEDMGDIADRYYHPFMPASETFTIWLVFYAMFLLLAYKELAEDDQILPGAQTLLYAFAGACNVAWLFVFTDGHIGYSCILIFALWLAVATLAYLRWPKAGRKDPKLFHMLRVTVTVNTVVEMYAMWMTFATIINFYTWVHHETDESRYFMTSAGIAFLYIVSFFTTLCVVNKRLAGMLVVTTAVSGIFARGLPDGPDEAKPFYYTMFITVIVGLVGIAVRQMRHPGEEYEQP